MWASSLSKMQKTGDVFEQFLVLTLKVFPLEIGERTKLHRDNRFGLIRRELIEIMLSLFRLEFLESVVSQGACHQFRRHLDRLQAILCLRTAGGLGGWCR